MNRRQSLVVSAALALLAFSLFWTFIGGAWWTAKTSSGSGLFSDLAPPAPEYDRVSEVLPGLFLPVLLLGIAGYLIAGLEPRPKEPEQEE